MATIRQRKIEALEDEVDKAERRLDSADLGHAAATMREDLNAANDRIKEMEETIRRLEGESRTSRARSRSSKGRGRSDSGSRSSRGSPGGREREASPCSATPIRERGAEGTEPRREGTTADANVDPAPTTSESSRGTESKGKPTRGDDEPRPMEVDGEGGEAKTKEERKGIFPSTIDGPEDDQIHITGTVRAVRGVANLIGYPALHGQDGPRLARERNRGSPNRRGEGED